jgi:hypothetical protein
MIWKVNNEIDLCAYEISDRSGKRSRQVPTTCHPPKPGKKKKKKKKKSERRHNSQEKRE